MKINHPAETEHDSKTQYKEAFASSLYELLKTKKISSITVKEIIEKSNCGGKNTFYTCFRDKYGVVEYIVGSQNMDIKYDTSTSELTDIFAPIIIKNTVITKAIFNDIKNGNTPKIYDNIKDHFNETINLYVDYICRSSSIKLDNDARVSLRLSITGLILGRLLDDDFKSSEIEINKLECDIRNTLHSLIRHYTNKD